MVAVLLVRGLGARGRRAVVLDVDVMNGLRAVACDRTRRCVVLDGTLSLAASYGTLFRDIPELDVDHPRVRCHDTVYILGHWHPRVTTRQGLWTDVLLAEVESDGEQNDDGNQ